MIEDEEEGYFHPAITILRNTSLPTILFLSYCEKQPLSHGHAMSEADVGSMTLEVEPFHQYSFTSCCCGTDGSRGANQTSGM